MPERILVVDDDPTIRQTVAEVLMRQGHDVRQAEDGASALRQAGEQSFALILLDLRLPNVSGLEIMPKLLELDDRTVVVVMTAYPEVRTAISSLKAGAYDYLNKPFDLDDLRGMVQRALEARRLRSEVEQLRATARHAQPVEELVGDSPEFRQLLEITRRIAAAGRSPVLIRGESGTGKEKVAQAIHVFSLRAAGPWITVNCSAISEGLLESEMFGHEKGAFTDAKERKRGLFELADGGTLFLDEVGDLSLALQPKLLRALDSQTFRRVGGQNEIKVDVRIVAATNRDLTAMIREGRFREDLYYRLNVAGIDMPPLRSRRSDILLLAEHFLKLGGATMKLPRPGVEPAAAELLETYAWPGNVRELRNVMERALILSGGQTIGPGHLPKELFGKVGPAAKPAEAASNAMDMTLAEAERRHILRVLDLCKGNKTSAAKRLDITRLTLRNKLRQFGVTDSGEE
ncbi:MAG: sigma-54-dependent Fis family transcriptional regulator [Alphaproteobacteria bacterium]|nr:sigma-54-dependent Fis family transcriptional regulator [Alphaproteobacteria bacterium]